MPFGSLLSSLKDVIGGNLPFGIGAKGGSNAYPDKINDVDVLKYTNKAGTGSEWKDSLGYSFHVVTSSEGKVGTAAGWKEFRLQINPQELSQDEVFAIEVTPTLRGVLVEHHGVTLKDITISGTTGISPNRKEGGTNKDGSPIFATGTSGYREFHDLRSYFRLYVEQKRTDARGDLRMIFKNYKDNEFLFVEPIKFTMKRSSKRPMMYDYTIVMKAIGVADKFEGAKDWATAFAIADNLDKAVGYIDQAVATIRGAFGVINRFQRDINAILLIPLTAVQQAILAVRGGTALSLTQLGITRKLIDDLRNVSIKVQNNFADAVGRDMGSYNLAANRTPTTVGNPNRQTTYDEMSIINALSDVNKGLLLVAGLNNEMFEENVFKQNQGVANAYGNAVVLQEPTSVESIDVLDTDDLQTIAAREYGDPDKFRDIAILNNLKPPFISATPMPGTIQPGGKILLPRYSGQGNSGVVRNKEYNITKELEESEKVLGVDIRVNEDGDLMISNTKDLDLIAGMYNMAQACFLRLGYQTNSLKRHQGIGTDLSIGQKASVALTEIRDQIVSSFSSDNRVESVPFVELIQEGGTIYINMLIKLKHVDQPIPLPLQLNVS